MKKARVSGAGEYDLDGDEDDADEPRSSAAHGQGVLAGNPSGGGHWHRDIGGTVGIPETAQGRGLPLRSGAGARSSLPIPPIAAVAALKAPPQRSPSGSSDPALPLQSSGWHGSSTSSRLRGAVAPVAAAGHASTRSTAAFGATPPSTSSSAAAAAAAVVAGTTLPAGLPRPRSHNDFAITWGGDNDFGDHCLFDDLVEPLYASVPWDLGLHDLREGAGGLGAAAAAAAVGPFANLNVGLPLKCQWHPGGSFSAFGAAAGSAQQQRDVPSASTAPPPHPATTAGRARDAHSAGATASLPHLTVSGSLDGRDGGSGGSASAVGSGSSGLAAAALQGPPPSTPLGGSSICSYSSRRRTSSARGSSGS